MEISKENTVIGFVGIGVMGESMARNILKSGYTVHIFTRTKSKAETLLDEGAVWEESVSELASKCHCIFTIVGFPPDVEEVYLGEDGILNNMQPGGCVVDMTTSKPELAIKIYEAAKALSIAALDAPVSGGDIGAREARLSIMCGGDKDTFDSIKPILDTMGTNVVYQGKPGSGQHTKMCNQIAIAAGMLGVCEAVAYATKSGLNPETVLESIGSGAAGSWSLTNLAPRMMKGNFEPGFFVKHFIKDMEIASESAKSMQLETPGLDLAKSLYEKLAEAGCENDGTQGLYKLYES